MSGPEVRVRMYRVGFGDCFLVTFPGPLRVLIDCGSLPGSGVPLDPVVADLVAATDGHLDVVVASHRHRDHIAGFGLGAAAFNRLDVNEVWLPWTDDPSDPIAAGAVRNQEVVARRLQATAGGAAALVAGNARLDEAALDVLRDGFAGAPRRRYLEGSEGDLPTRALPGVHVRVLGPLRGADAVHRLDLEARVARFTLEEGGRPASPFGRRHRLAARHVGALFGRELAARPALPELAAQSADDLVWWLDRTLNNQSLVLRFRCGRARLLFPGDAQLEAWLAPLGRDDVTDLAEIALYKVSHHGSRNGTPRRLLARLGAAASLVSARRVPGFPDLPRRELLAELAARGGLVRSDRRDRVRDVVHAKLWSEIAIPCA